VGVNLNSANNLIQSTEHSGIGSLALGITNLNFNNLTTSNINRSFSQNPRANNPNLGQPSLILNQISENQGSSSVQRHGGLTIKGSQKNVVVPMLNLPTN
jgi:hypothetical protein